MAGYWTALSSHVTGSIREKDLAYLILSNDDDSRRRVAGAAVVQWEPDAWRDGGQVAWNVAGTAIAPSPLEQCCIVGERGGVVMLRSGDRHLEQIGKGNS